MAPTTIDQAGIIKAVSGKMVTVTVGREGKRYHIHKDLLTTQSLFFDRALNGNFKEAGENAISLEEESSAAFDLLIGWLYQRRIAALGPPFGGFKTPEPQPRIEDSIVPGTIVQIQTPNGPQFRRVLSGPHSLFDVDMRTASPPPTALPENHGTVRTSYQPYTEPTHTFMHYPPPPPGAFDLFQPISAQKKFRLWSPEELRLADYSVNRKYGRLLDNNSCLDDALVRLTVNNPFARQPGSKDLTGPTTAKLNALPPLVPLFYSDHSGRSRISGVPHSASVSTLMAVEEAHQIAVLDLAMMAETLCWDMLFNVSFTAYIHGEATLSSRRTLPCTHIALIYRRTHPSSPARKFAVDAVMGMLCAETKVTKEEEEDNGGQGFEEEMETQIGEYRDVALEHPSFLRDIFTSLGPSRRGSSLWSSLPLPLLLMHQPPPPAGAGQPNYRGICTYHAHPAGEDCATTNTSIFAGLETTASRTNLFAKAEDTSSSSPTQSILEQRQRQVFLLQLRLDNMRRNMAAWTRGTG